MSFLSELAWVASSGPDDFKNYNLRMNQVTFEELLWLVSQHAKERCKYETICPTKRLINCYFGPVVEVIKTGSSVVRYLPKPCKFISETCQIIFDVHF
jgi:hypothetical protein